MLRALTRALHGRILPGWCPYCGPTLFDEQGNFLRDEYICRRCRSLPRHRALAVVLAEVAPRWREMTILEPGGGGPPSQLLSQCRRYIPTKYEELTPQEIDRGVRREDLRALSLEDASVDLVVTSDVFEHVIDPGSAFREIARVLRPGGAHVFTVPIYDRRETVVRIDDDGRELMEVTCHGPFPVVREWGDDVVAFVEAHGGTPTKRLQPFSRWHGIRGVPLYEHGPMIDVLVSRKVAA